MELSRDDHVINMSKKENVPFAKNTKTYQRKKGVKKSSRAMILYDQPKQYVEKKIFDVTETTFSCPLTASFGTPVLINGIVQGSGSNERLGRRFTMTSVEIRARMTATAPAGQFRTVVVWDRQSNFGATIATDVFLTNGFSSMMNPANTGRYVKIVDEVCDTAPSTQLTCSTHIYRKFRLDAHCTGTSGTAAAFSHGSLWLMFANNADFTVGVASTVDYSSRVRYQDA